MAAWGSGSESGILRKNRPKDNHEDLLVFGYACKLFRDDDKALYIDQGKHLIPWMGDDKLKIDRYDCRGALSDIASFVGNREGFDTMRWLGLNESERKLEQLCDKERYYSLHINEEEEEMYKDEEQKRLKTNEFKYSYDVPAEPQSQEPTAGPELEEEEDEEFVAPPSLDVPVDVPVPKSVKENARIEKTALFVCKQGLQMEILIKAKQSDNPQFGFLNHGHNLYKYYRHVLAAIKNGRYQVAVPRSSDNKQGESGEGASGEEHYLHPSLISANTTTHNQTETQVPTPVPYRPSANCTYSQLVTRIQQGNNQQESAPTVTTDTTTPPPPLSAAPTEINKNHLEGYSHMTYEQQQYYQYYYAAQYYEYYKQLAQYQQGNIPPSGQTVTPPDMTSLDPSVQTYIQQMAYTQYMQHQQSQSPANSYAQIVSNVNKDVSNPYSTLLANIQTVTEDVTQSKERAVIANNSVEETRTVTQLPKNPVAMEMTEKKSLLLADYGSDTSDDDDDAKEQVKMPDGDVKVVIDKMASYVAKNGEQFEEIVKAKGDPRFDFLNRTHELNAYYKMKLGECKNVEGGLEKKEVILVANTLPKPSSTTATNNNKEKKTIAPVSFSIKKPKDDPPKEIKSALPVEESDDDANNEDGKSCDVRDVTDCEKDEDPVSGDLVATDEPLPPCNGILDGDDPILEMIDLTDDIEERKDAKRAEDKLRDKLAAAARERMARDRALQLERKRKAAAFLKLKSAEVPTDHDVMPKSNKPLPCDKKKEVVEVADSGDDSGDDEKKRKSLKKKKTHKRKHSKSKHDSSKSKKSKRKSSSSTNSNKCT